MKTARQSYPEPLCVDLMELKMQVQHASLHIAGLHVTAERNTLHMNPVLVSGPIGAQGKPVTY